ncbi:hypothetical protein VitviT2T_007626 [Vitis vinifera]|nr:hypothetical protein VitviT2T_007626 [Vitis vinifera]
MGLDAAPFFTQSCAVSAISYHENHGTFKLPLEGSMISIPSLPPLDTDHDLPSLVKDMDSYPAIMKINLNQFSAFHKVKCVFFNTYHKLEHEEPFTSSYQYGHINPMLQFSKRLASKGIKVTLVIAATSNSQSMHAQTSSINIEIISEEFDRRQQEESIEDYLERFRILASQGLTALMEKHNRSNHPAKLLIYDSVLPWAQDLAEHLGLDGVPFFTQSCAVSAIYYHFYQGVFNTPLEESTVSMPSMPLLRVDDLPSFINVKSPVDSALLNLVLSQFSNFKKGKWILCNTFDKLEDQVMKWMTSQRPLIKTIGPTVPSMYLDKRLEDDKDYGLSLFQQNHLPAVAFAFSSVLKIIKDDGVSMRLESSEVALVEMACDDCSPAECVDTHLRFKIRKNDEGHINPMFQFSKRLASKGLKVTLLITTSSISKSMHAQDSSINIEIICEGFDQRKAESIEDSLERYRIAASQSLVELIEQHSRSNHPAKILVYDSILPWAQDVAERQGLHGASFFTQSCAVSAIYYHFNQRAFSSPLEGSVVALPSMPLFHVNDLPSFISDKGSDAALLNLLLNQFSNFQKVKWILFNTFTKLEDELTLVSIHLNVDIVTESLKTKSDRNKMILNNA